MSARIDLKPIQTQNGVASFVPHYQPIVSLRNKKISKYEMLARFISGDGHALSPIDMADMFDNERFLKELLTQSIHIMSTSTHMQKVSINIDPICFENSFVYDLLDSVPHNLCSLIDFEITERDIGNNLTALISAVPQLRKRGFKVSMDDFGSGSANLRCLEKVKFDAIKIDGYFLKNARNGSGLSKLKSMVEFLRHYEVELIAEHIENEEIAMIAEGLGFDYGQGFYYGMPKPKIILDENDYHEKIIAS